MRTQALLKKQWSDQERPELRQPVVQGARWGMPLNEGEAVADDRRNECTNGHNERSIQGRWHSDPTLQIILFRCGSMCELTADRFYSRSVSAFLARTALSHNAPRGAAVIAHRADHPCQHRSCRSEEQEARDQDRKPFALEDRNEAQHQAASLRRGQGGGYGFFHYPWHPMSYAQLHFSCQHHFTWSDRRSNCALIATTTVLMLISTAPIAGPITKPEE